MHSIASPSLETQTMTSLNVNSAKEINNDSTDQKKLNQELWDIHENKELPTYQKIQLMGEAIEKGADVNALHGIKKNKLLLHSVVGDRKLAEFLVKNGADPFKRDGKDKHACFYWMDTEMWELFCQFGGIKIKELLTHSSTNEDYLETHSFLYHICTNLHINDAKKEELLDFLLKHKEDLKNVFVGCYSIVHELLMCGKIHFAEKCIQCGFVDPNIAHPKAEQDTPLRLALLYKEFDGAVMLIRNGAQLDRKSFNEYIIPLGELGPLASVILEKIAFPFYRWSKIHFAARSGSHVDLKAILKEDPSSVNSTIFNNYTPLHLSAKEDRFLNAFILLEAGADPFAKDGNGLIAGENDIDKDLSLCSQNMVDFLKIYREFKEPAEKAEQLRKALKTMQEDDRKDKEVLFSNIRHENRNYIRELKMIIQDYLLQEHDFRYSSESPYEDQ